MTWAVAKSAVNTALTAFRRLGFARLGPHGHVANIVPRSRPAGSDGAPTTAIDLRARAERLCNRSPKAVARYLEKQAVLMNGKGS